MTSFAVRARGPCSVKYSPTRSQRSFVPIGNFWLHALSRSLSSSSSVHGSVFAAPPPSEADEPFEEEDTRSVRTSLSVDAHQNLTVEVDVPAHGETQLTRYFSWTRRS